MTNPIVRLFALLAIILVPFFYLINNINLLTSVLNKQNRSLNREKNALELSLERKNNDVSNNLDSEIQDKLNAGTIQLVNLQETTPITEITKPKEEVVPN